MKDTLKAILRGKFLIHIGLGEYLIHILYVFTLFAMVIWVSMMIDNTLAKVKENKEVLNDLEIVYTDMLFQEAEATSRKAVEKNLKALGSEVTEPKNPATIIRNGR